MKLLFEEYGAALVEMAGAVAFITIIFYIFGFSNSNPDAESIFSSLWQFLGGLIG